MGGQTVLPQKRSGNFVEHSAQAGVLEPSSVGRFSGIMDLQVALLVESLIAPGKTPTSVPKGATVADVQAAANRSGHLRVLLENGPVPHVVHVRDTLLDALDEPASTHARPAYVIAAGTPVYEVLSRMREASVQLAVVMDGDRMLGVVTLADVLRRVLPQPV